MGKGKAADLRFAVETVTPERAKEYLERNKGNRQLSKRTVQTYAEAIKRGEWKFNGESIKFDGAGNLIDGQHRLHAIVLAGIAVELAVFRDLAVESFATIDTGRNRTAGDVLSIMGTPYANEVAAAARLVYAHTVGQPRLWRGMTNALLIGFLEQHPQLVECANAAMRTPLTNRMLPRSVTVFGYYVASRLSEQKAHRFFAELASGRFEKRGSEPIYQLREKLIRTEVEVLKPSAQVKCAWMILAWNAFYAGRSTVVLRRDHTGFVPFEPSPIAS